MKTAKCVGDAVSLNLTPVPQVNQSVSLLLTHTHKLECFYKNYTLNRVVDVTANAVEEQFVNHHINVRFTFHWDPNTFDFVYGTDENVLLLKRRYLR